MARTEYQELLSPDEEKACRRIQSLLERMARGRFICTERKGLGKSVINKPVDLHIRMVSGNRDVVVAVEVASVNTTQLVGETTRLFCDVVPRKLLVLGDRNVPRGGKTLCERLLFYLYGQDEIEGIPARVVRYSNESEIEDALRELLLLHETTAA